MKNIFLIPMIAVLMISCVSQDVAKKSPNNSTIQLYFKDREVETVKRYDIERAEEIMGKFREYLNKKGISKLDIAAPTIDMDSVTKANFAYYAELAGYSKIIIHKSEPETGYEFINMRGEDDLNTIVHSQYETFITLHNGGLMEIMIGCDLKSKKSNQWVRVVIDRETGGIILYEKPENRFRRIELKLTKKGELKVTPPEMSANSLINEGTIEFYTALELLEQIDRKMTGK